MAERQFVWNNGQDIPEDPIPDENGYTDDAPGDVRQVYVPQVFRAVAPDGSEMRFEVLGLFANEDRTRQYLILHGEGAPADEAFITPFGEDGEGMVELLDFESDEEYEAAEERFQELFRSDIYGDGVYSPSSMAEFMSEEDEQPGK